MGKKGPINTNLARLRLVGGRPMKRQTLNGHLPPNQGPHSRQTLAKCVSDDSPRFIFRHHKFFQNMFFHPKTWILQISRFGGAVIFLSALADAS